MCPNAPKFTVFLRPESLMLNRTFVGRDFGWKWRRKALARSPANAKAKYPYYFYSKKAFLVLTPSPAIYARYGAARGEAVREN